MADGTDTEAKTKIFFAFVPGQTYQPAVEFKPTCKCGAMMATGKGLVRLELDEQTELQFDEGQMTADLIVQHCLSCGAIRGTVEVETYSGY